MRPEQTIQRAVFDHLRLCAQMPAPLKELKVARDSSLIQSTCAPVLLLKSGFRTMAESAG
jgi:hypothetical protein